MTDEIKQLLLKVKPVKILLLLREDKEWYISELARKSGVTYVYTDYVINKLEKAGLIKTDKKGRKVTVKLTEKGLHIASIFEDIDQRLGTPSENNPPL